MKLETVGKVLAAAGFPDWEAMVREASATGQSLWDSGEAGEDAPDMQVSITHQRDDEFDLELASYVPAAEMIMVS